MKREKVYHYTSKWYGKILHIYDPIFMQNYYYFNCKTEKEYSNLLKIRFKIDRDLKDTEGGCEVYEQAGIDVCFIWTKGFSFPILAHEVMHAISYVLRRKGIKLSNETDEIYGYLMNFLIKEILGRYGKRKN